VGQSLEIQFDKLTQRDWIDRESSGDSLTTPFLAAFALAVVIAVQGAGVSQSVENPDGSSISPSRDMLAPGAASQSLQPRPASRKPTRS